MKFLRSRFGLRKGSSHGRLDAASAFDSLPGGGDSRLGSDSRLGVQSRFADSRWLGDSRLSYDAEARAEAEARYELRKQLLQVVLARTVQKTGVPAAWFDAELNPMITPAGEEWIELRLSVQVDEPRLLAYLTSFQAEFERRLIEAAPDAREWVSGIAWKLTPDPVFEMALPQPPYWDLIQQDRLLTARQKGAAEWDRESLARHFSDTNPGELADFEDTHPPERDVEDLVPPERR